MTYDYAPIAATALRLLTRFGQSVTLTQETAPAYDSTTMVVTPTTATYSRKAVLVDYDRINFGTVLQDGTQEETTDKRAYVDAGTISPEVGNTLTFPNGLVYRICNVKTVAPGGTAVLYDCRVRR